MTDAKPTTITPDAETVAVAPPPPPHSRTIRPLK